jgi:hypothetical protein
MTQSFFLAKAADCARAAVASSDPAKREMLTKLQKWWIDLARENPLIDDQVAEQIAKLEAIYADLVMPLRH